MERDRRQHGWDALDAAMAEQLREALARFDNVQDQQRFIDALAEELPRVFDDSAERIVEDLFGRAPTMLSEHGDLDAAQVAGIRGIWGDALDTYRMVLVAAHESGEAFSARHFNVDGYEPTAMADAQLGLHARACRVALEVFVLLRHGLAGGALARARTLHEISVTSSALARFGKADGETPNLAEAYLDHAAVVTYMDALDYQESAPKIGLTKFDESEMAEMKKDRDEAVKKHGVEFGRGNGWAAVLTEKGKAPRFRDLEELTEEDGMRSYYAWASHEVHSDAKAWELNHATIGGITFRSTGPSPIGLADPAQMALVALLRVTTNLLYCVADIEDRPSDVLSAAVLTKLVDRAGDAFVAAHQAAERQAEGFGSAQPSAP